MYAYFRVQFVMELVCCNTLWFYWFICMSDDFILESEPLDFGPKAGPVVHSNAGGSRAMLNADLFGIEKDPSEKASGRLHQIIKKFDACSTQCLASLDPLESE